MKIAVGSKNKAKIKAVETVLSHMEENFSLIEVDAPSDVSGMPFSDEETARGAVNRAEYCIKHHDAQWGFGLEGGVTETPFGLFLINWGAIAERGAEPIIAGGARIRLPNEIAKRLRAGEELGPVMDDYCNRENVRSSEGAIGVFTNGMVNRADMFTHIVNLLIGQKNARNVIRY